MGTDIERLCEEFALGPVLQVNPLAGGGAEVAEIHTITGRYVIKPAYRAWELDLYSTVEQALNTRGVRQARLFRDRDGGVLSSSGHSVQEWLPGVMNLRPGPRHRHAFFTYLARYDRALADLPVPLELAAADTVFTRVCSPRYLIDQLPRLLQEHAAHLDPAPVHDGLLRLSGAMDDFAQLSEQIVHGDHGPDNVLFDGEDVVAIIDFSPYLAPALFGLATALYWFHVHGTPDLPGIEISLSAYGAHRQLSVEELALWPAMLLREGLRRLATPLAVQEESGQRAAPERLQGRYAALRVLVDHLPA